jgi:phosphoribosylanthranilate isomerase
MKNPIVKICGVTSIKDALMVSGFPIYAIGLNFIERSKRKVDLNTAKEIIKELPISIGAVLILEDEKIKKVIDLCNLLSTNNVQLHGNESSEYCKELKKKKKTIKIIKALKAEEETLQKLKDYEKVCDFILLDSANKKNQMGGTGKTADWKIARKIIEKSKLPVILAGGLNPDNIKDAIKKVKPYAIDMNSGVESKPGKKDEELIRKLFNALKN